MKNIIAIIVMYIMGNHNYEYYCNHTYIYYAKLNGYKLGKFQDFNTALETIYKNLETGRFKTINGIIKIEIKPFCNNCGKRG